MTSEPSPAGAFARTVRIELAVAALCALDETGPATPRPLNQLDGDWITSRKSLSEVLGELRHHGILGSLRGPAGGYWLARPLSEITLLDVIVAVGLPDPEAHPATSTALDARLGRALSEISLVEFRAFLEPGWTA